MKKNRTIAVMNQKGGVGKTTTAINLSVGLHRLGFRVLLVDTDPQGNATTGMGVDKKSKNSLKTMLEYIIMEEEFDPKEGVVRQEEGIDIVPANILLEGVEMTLTTLFTQPKEFVLKKYLDQLKNSYDFIIIDCRPALGTLAVNALAAADSVLIPVQPESYAVEGMQELFKTIFTAKERMNPALKIEGIVYTLDEERTNQSKSYKAAIQEAYGRNINIFQTNIPSRVAISEASGYGISIHAYAERHSLARPAAGWYMQLAREVCDNGSE